MRCRSVAECPLFMAAIVAICGVALIVISTVWPSGQGAGDASSRIYRSEHLYDAHLRVLDELRRVGVTGNVGVVDYGDGLGLGVSQTASKGSVLLQVPEAFALDVERTRSCPGDMLSPPSEEEASIACSVERAVVKAVGRGEASRFAGMMALLVLERRRGLIDGLEPTAISAALAVLPDISWQAESGVFTIEEEEFRILSAGSSMEGWQQAAINETTRAHDFVQRTVASKLGDDVKIGLDEVRWAYLVLLGHAHWTDSAGNPWNATAGDDSGTNYPAQAVFLTPLLISRPTPEWKHGAQLRHDRENRVFDIIAPRPMRAGEEIHFVDRRLSDASVLCYRGLQLVGQHRAQLTLNVSSAKRDPAAQPMLDRFGCGAQPLRLYVHAQKAVDPHFLACMRMLALAGNATLLRRAERAGWMRTWPETSMVDRRTESTATELAAKALEQILVKLGASSADIRQRFGSDSVATRPTVKVREAETMIVVGLLKAMRELQLVSSNEYLFEALRDSHGKRGKARQSAGGTSRRGGGKKGSAQASL